jgi:hypothetical protein
VTASSVDCVSLRLTNSTLDDSASGYAPSAPCGSGTTEWSNGANWLTAVDRSRTGEWACAVLGLEANAQGPRWRSPGAGGGAVGSWREARSERHLPELRPALEVARDLRYDA